MSSTTVAGPKDRPLHYQDNRLHNRRVKNVQGKGKAIEMKWSLYYCIMQLSLVLVICLFRVDPASAQQCAFVDHARDDWQALNTFWQTNIPLCQLPPGSNNAYADRMRGIVFADEYWLDQVAATVGQWAATGIIAHEWGHMVQGNVPGGTAAELQADCLAGVFMRGEGLPWQTVEQFATMNFTHGDIVWTEGGHGTGLQRATAAHRGYYGFTGQTGQLLAMLCPYSVF